MTSNENIRNCRTEFLCRVSYFVLNYGFVLFFLFFQHLVSPLPFFCFPIPLIFFVFFFQKFLLPCKTSNSCHQKKTVIFSITKKLVFLLLQNYFPLAISWELCSNTWPAQRQADIYLQDITIHC